MNADARALQSALRDERRARKAIEGELALLKAVLAMIAQRRVDRVSLRTLARDLRRHHQALSRLLVGRPRAADLTARPALETWLAARGECAACVAALEIADFIKVLQRHVQPITRASRAPKEPNK